MKEIQLTQGQTALVDDEDFEYLNQWKWYAQKDRYTYYAIRRNGKKRMWMHRAILELNDPNLLADHIDHNGLNNQRNNLRIATRSQNSANKQSHRKLTSSYLGVCRMDNGWQAHIYKGDIHKYLGFFNDEKDAAIAYNKAAIEFHGEFANLNKVTA